MAKCGDLSGADTVPYMLETGFLKRDRTWWDKDVGSELLYPNFVKIMGSLKQ